MSIGRAMKGYTSQFEPWFCRILFELGADHSFDGIQDSRLFGSPEFTAQFPNQADRLKVAQEIRRQEKRLLKTNGIVIHSDADALLR